MGSDWLFLVYDVQEDPDTPVSTVRSKISRKLLQYPHLLPLQQSVYAVRDSPEGQADIKHIVSFFQDEFGEKVKLMVFKGEPFLDFTEKQMQELAGGPLDARYRGMEHQLESLAKAFKKRETTKTVARRQLAKLLLKFEAATKHDPRSMMSPARAVFENKASSIEKELSDVI